MVVHVFLFEAVLCPHRIDTYSEYGFAFTSHNTYAQTTTYELAECLTYYHSTLHSITLDKRIILSANKVGHGLMLMEFTGLTMVVIFQRPNRMVEKPLKTQLW